MFKVPGRSQTQDLHRLGSSVVSRNITKAAEATIGMKRLSTR